MSTQSDITSFILPERPVKCVHLCIYSLIVLHMSWIRLDWFPSFKPSFSSSSSPSCLVQSGVGWEAFSSSSCSGRIRPTAAQDCVPAAWRQAELPAPQLLRPGPNSLTNTQHFLWKGRVAVSEISLNTHTSTHNSLADCFSEQETTDYGRPITVGLETGLQNPDEGPVLDPDWPSTLRAEVRVRHRICILHHF